MILRMLIDAVERRCLSRTNLPASNLVLQTAFCPIGAPGQNAEGLAWVPGPVSTYLVQSLYSLDSYTKVHSGLKQCFAQFLISVSCQCT